VKKRALFLIDTWLLNWFSKAEVAISDSLMRRIEGAGKGKGLNVGSGVQAKTGSAG
jgi:hypothetical protein